MRRRSAGERVAGDADDVAAEERDQPAGRLHGQEDQPQQRRLAGARRAGQELERVRLDREGEVAQDLRPHAVAHADILELNHRPLGGERAIDRPSPAVNHAGPRNSMTRGPWHMRAAGLICHADRLPVLRKRIHDRAGADRGGWSHGALRRLPRHLFVAGEPEPTDEALADDRGVPMPSWSGSRRLADGRRAVAVEAESARSEHEVGPAAARLRLPSIAAAAVRGLPRPRRRRSPSSSSGSSAAAVLGRERIVAAAPRPPASMPRHLAVNPRGLDLKEVALGARPRRRRTSSWSSRARS